MNETVANLRCAGNGTEDPLRRVLVTGGAGFIGSHVCDRLIALGHDVVAVDDLSLGREENLTHLALSPRFAFHRISLLDPGLDETLGNASFDAVVHLAANSDIRAGTLDRTIDLERTFHTTCAACELAVRRRIPELLFASSSAVIGPATGALAETHGPQRPVSFYGAAKMASEAFLSAYTARCGLRTWVFRFPNVVGPRLTHGVIYDFAERLAACPDRLDVLGDGHQEKPYLHVDELLDAMLFAWRAPNPEGFSVLNVGTESATSVRRIAEIVISAFGLAGRTEVVFEASPFGWPGDVPHFAYDLTRIHALGWRASLSSDEAVRRAAAALAKGSRGTT